VEANPVRIVQYFDGEKQSIIPLFQRPYTWEKRNWQTLWEDILTHYELGMNSSHFMGAVVSIPAKTVPVGVTKHLIIDGQQRLTTIALLLCALRDTVADKRVSDQIQDYLVNRHYKDSPDYLKLLPTHGYREAYWQLMDSNVGKSPSHAMTEGYEYFKHVLGGDDNDGEPIDHLRVLNTTRQCLQVVMINLGESDDPYLIFESLNYKGEALTQADLVRNYVLMRFRHSLESGGEQERVYNNLWHPLEKILGENLGEFLRHYASMNGANIKKPKIYAAIKAKFAELKTIQDVQSEIAEMKRHGNYYAIFLNPEKEPDSEVRRRLQALSKMEVSISFPLLLKLFRAYDREQYNGVVLTECIGIIESLILRRTVCDEKRSALNKLFIRLASKFPFEANVDEWLRSELVKTVRSERWPEDEEFEKAMKTGQLYGTKGIKLLFEGLESYYAGKEMVDLSHTNITIEHIMPQQLTDEWRHMLGPSHNEIHKRFLHTAGNLTLTACNPEMSNLPFSKKKEMYAKSGIAMNRKIACEDTWGEEQILQRAERLADDAKKVWKRSVRI